MTEVDVTDPAILIRIPRLYHPGMGDQELYDAVRGTWRAGQRREKASIALAVAGGVVREVYVIGAWHPAGTTEYRARDSSQLNTYRRWEFTGRVAPPEIRNRYVGGLVAHYFTQGQANPIQYVNA